MAAGRLGAEPTIDTWRQWAATLDSEPGHHRLAVRAIDRTGQVQTSVVQDVLPDGSTGLHQISFQRDGGQRWVTPMGDSDG